MTPTIPTQPMVFLPNILPFGFGSYYPCSIFDSNAVMAGFYAGFSSTPSFSQASLSSKAPYVPNFPIPYSFASINPYTMFDPNLGMPGFSIGNGNNNGTIITCQLCRKIGHGAKTCRTLSFLGKGGYNGENGGFSRNTSGNGSGTIIICQLCKKIGHGAKTCRTLSIVGKGGYNGENGGFSRNTSGNGSGNIMTCQLCKKIGHGAKTCSSLSTFQQGNNFNNANVGHQYCGQLNHTVARCYHLDFPNQQQQNSIGDASAMFGLNSVLTKAIPTDISQLPISAKFTDDVISATPPLPTSTATQRSLCFALPINNAPPSQVFNPLQISPAYPLSISTRHLLQQVLLKEIEALQTPNTWLVPSTTLDRSLMNCRKVCQPMVLCQSLPLIPPG